MNLIYPDWSGAPAKVRAFFTTRNGGVSLAPYDDGTSGAGGLNTATHVGDNPAHVAQNRARVRALLPAEPVWLNQVHGAAVVDAAGATGIPDTDASFTSRSNVVCVVQTADCLPVLLCDAAGSAVAAVHAGWRSLAAGVIENTVRRMREAGAGDILAWLGPAIGPQAFEVGEDVLEAFAALSPHAPEAFRARPDQPGKYFADIYALARAALAQVGVARVSGGGFCTVTEKHRFYSFRRDDVTGRMAALIWLD